MSQLFDPRAFRDTLGQFCSGVVIATGCENSQPAGLAAQSFSSLSLDPPLVLICPAKTSTSWPKIRASRAFCINILGDDQKRVCDVFAKSGIDKFAELNWRLGASGSPIIEDVLAYVDCELDSEYEAGDHTIAVGRVLEARIVDSSREPLLFFRGGYGSFDAFSDA
ncbi:MAG: flavin reductase family protein [Gammaproteobacteria bacterium]|nr:flavin reductase family protein [Gammaproteobacteria bacterium]